jgi:hypothetical protein
MTDTDPDSADALVAALLDLDRHVGRDGWDQPPRLFALVLNNVLAEAEPVLSREMGLRATKDGGLPGALTAIEQDEFRSTGELTRDLATLQWPESVFGCALATVRTFLPAAHEADLPDDPEAAAATVAAHPQRQEIRVVVGVDRAGNRHGVGRLASRPEEVLGAPDLVPGLASALAHTLC